MRALLPYAARGANILYEHRKRIRNDMFWIMEKLQWEDGGMAEIIQRYGENSENLELLHNLLNKVWVTCDRSILPKVANKIREQYRLEKTLVEAFTNAAFEYYTYTHSKPFSDLNKADISKIVNGKNRIS